MFPEYPDVDHGSLNGLLIEAAFPLLNLGSAMASFVEKRTKPLPSPYIESTPGSFQMYCRLKFPASKR